MKDTRDRREKLTATLGEVAVELRGIKDHMEGDAVQNTRISNLEADVKAIERGDRGGKR